MNDLLWPSPHCKGTALKTSAKCVMTEVYSPAGWRGQKAPSWLEWSIAAGRCRRRPWSAALGHAGVGAECSSRRKLLHQPLSGSRTGYCFPVALDRLFRSQGTSLEKTKQRHLLKRRRKKKTSPGEIGCREQADTQTGGPQRFLILLLAHTLFTSSCAQKVFLKTDAAQKRWREEKKPKAFPFSAI